LNTAPVESAGTAEKITQPLKQEKSTFTGWNVVFQKYKNMPKLVRTPQSIWGWSTLENLGCLGLTLSCTNGIGWANIRHIRYSFTKDDCSGKRLRIWLENLRILNFAPHFTLLRMLKMS
jgi:hypothetical protein